MLNGKICCDNRIDSMDLTKEIVHAEAMRLIKGKIDLLQNQILELSSDADIKSTSGDKHETSRAMMHLQQEQLTTQLGELRSQMNKLSSLRDSVLSKKISEGSLIVTDKAIFYLSIAFGRIAFSENSVYLLSVNSPLGRILCDKIENEIVNMNGTNYRILKIN